MNTCLIQIQVGDPVEEKTGKMRRGIVKSITIVPSGINLPELVASLVVELTNGTRLSATSNHFVSVNDYQYDEQYPSIGLTKKNEN